MAKVEHKVHHTRAHSTYSGKIVPPGFEHACPVGPAATKGFRGAYETDDMVRVTFLAWCHSWLDKFPLPCPPHIDAAEWRGHWLYRLSQTRAWGKDAAAMAAFFEWIARWEFLKEDIKEAAEHLARVLEEESENRGEPFGYWVFMNRYTVIKKKEALDRHIAEGIEKFWVGRVWNSQDTVRAA